MNFDQAIKLQRAAAVFVLILSTVFLAAADKKTLGPINETELRMHLEFLASRELGGRDTLSPNFQIAAKYLSTRLQGYGYKGVKKDDDFFQEFDIVSTHVRPEKSKLVLQLDGQQASFDYGQFFNAGDAGGVFEAPLVFAGYGISSASQRHDDYAGLNVAGKIVVISMATPSTVDRSRLGLEEHKIAAAKAHGAAAVIYLPLEYELKVMSRSTYVDRTLTSTRLAAEASGIPIVRVNKDVARRLLSAAGIEYSAFLKAQSEGLPLKPAQLNGNARVELAMDMEKEITQNVVGVLRGSDPKLRDEFVLLSAHYDHLGIGRQGDFYPGANDDGSGTASVLAIAQALADDRPKRSILVIFHAGEELGLLGSKYNGDHAPIVPLGKIVVDLNIDMIGRSRRFGDTNPENAQMTDANTIYVIGADRTSKALHRLHEQTNHDVADLRLDYTLNDVRHPDQIFFRSDHWNYGKHGVPFIFYFDGVGEDYHQPTDTVDKIDFKKMKRVATLAYYTALRIANLPERLPTDLPAPRSAAAR